MGAVTKFGAGRRGEFGRLLKTLRFSAEIRDSDRGLRAYFGLKLARNRGQNPVTFL